MSVGDQQGIAHDKPGTLSDLHDRLMQQHPDIEQESLIAAVLLMEPSVEDCAVFSRTHHKVAGTVARHPAEFVACVVNSGAFSADRFRSFLSERLPANLVPAHYLPLSRLPLQGDGRVDFASLKRLPILDDELIAAWEAVATQTPAVEQAAVMVKPTRLQTPAVHLSELLPHGHSLDPLSPQFATTIDEAPADVPPASTVMSLTYGGDLPTPAGFPQTLPEVLQQAAAKALGDRITHLEADGTIVQQSYAQLLAEAQCILTGLRQQGLKPQDKVIFQLELTQDIVAAFWGCVLGGFIPVIMGTAPSYREANNVVDKLCNVWRLIDEPLILTTQALQTSLQHLEQWLPGDAAPPSRLKISAIEDLRQNTPDPHPHPCQPDDLAFFNLTSGSTGMPKCIGLTHRNLITRAQGTNILCQHSPEDVILNWLPFDHIGSISDWHIRCVLLGCFLIYTTKEYVLGRPLNWIDLLHRYRISHSWAPNFAYALVNDSLKQDAEAKYPWDLSCVKGLLTAGEAVSSSAVEEFIDRLAVYGFPRTALRSAFGMAEMGSGITYYQPTIEKPVLRHVVDKASLTGDVPLRRVTPDHPNCSIFTDLGPVIPGISIRIVNGQNELLPEEMVGNLQVKGLPVSPGYYKNPTVNQEVFLADGWFQTGDLGFVSQDHLVITGRAKETIIINGANYYNHEIEAAVELVDQVEVSFTAACGVKAPGSATEKLAIFFNTAVEAEEDLAELLKTIRQTVVAKVGLNPDYLIPVAQGAVPKTAIGKIQRSQLSQRFEQGEFQDILKHMDLLLGNANTIPDWFFRQVWQPKQISTPVVSLGTTVTLIFEDGSGLGDQLQALLRREGGQCMAVMPGEGFTVLGNDTYAVNPTQPEDYHTLFQHLDEQNQRPTQILYLWGTGDAPLPVPDEPTPWDQPLQRGIYSLLTLVQALPSLQPSPEHPLRLCVHTPAAQAVHPQEPVQAFRSMIPALLKAAAQELPWLIFSCVDTGGATVSDQAQFLHRELSAPVQLDPEVAYRSGVRLVPRFDRIDWAPPATSQPCFQSQGIYLISGGLGGVGFEVAKYLLEQFQAKLILLGQTPLSPEQDIENPRLKRYQTLTALGAVHYAAVDLGNAAQLQSVVQEVTTTWGGALNGILHLAGRAAERSILAEMPQSLAKTLYPKVAGVLALQQVATAQGQDCLFLNFSSVNGFFGGSQAGAYAAANRFLDAFSQTLRQQGIPCINLAWSMWDDVGMSQGFALKEFSRLQGYYALPIHQALQSLEGCLQHYVAAEPGFLRLQDQVWIGLDATKANVRRYLVGEPIVLQSLQGYFTASTPVAHHSLEALSVTDRFGTLSPCKWQQLETMPLTETGEIDKAHLANLEAGSSGEYVQPRNEVEQHLAELWQKVLDVPQVGIQDSFFELGGTSLQAAKLFARIAEEFGKNLPLSTLFEAQTVEAIAALLAGEVETNPWSSLVKIQGNGSRPPLFCVHGAGGNILMYKELVPYLAPDQPLYGLQAVGLDGQAPILHLQDMAKHYADEILQAQPTGPYYLLGLSIGGMLAMEIARLLQRQGHTVALLAMIDALGPGYPKLLPLKSRLISLAPYMVAQGARRLPNWIEKKLQRSKSAPAKPPENKPPVPPAPAAAQPPAPKRRRGVKGTLEELSLQVYKYSQWAFVVPRFYLASGKGLPANYQRVQEAAIKAFMEYNPEVYSGDFVLFRATQQPPGCYKDPTLGWGKVIQGEMTIVDVPGHHGESLLYQAQSAQVIGDRLNQLLLEIQKAQP